MKKVDEDKKYKKGFEILYRHLVNAYMVFYVWKSLQNSDYQNVYSKNNYFWTAVMSSLMNTWISYLAKVYENSKRVKRGQVFSIYYMEEFQKDLEKKKSISQFLQKHEILLDRLRVYRNNGLFHENANADIDSLLTVMTYGEFEDLLEDTEELLHIIHPENGHHFSLEHIKRDSEKSVQNIMKKLNEEYE